MHNRLRVSSLIALVACLATPMPGFGLIERCTGDCNNGSDVTVDEVLTMVGIALGETSAAVCPVADRSCDGEVTVEELLSAVGDALRGCPQPPRGMMVVPASEPVGVIRTTEEGIAIGGTPHMPPQYSVPNPSEVQVEDYVTGLEVPWALEFASDGRLFVTERRGQVRVVIDRQLQATPWVTVQVDALGESGLMGLALHPDFPAEPYVYLCLTKTVGGEFQNRIVRYTEVDGQGTNPEILLQDIPGYINHDGCRLKFGPDGKLYASTGDGGRRAVAQQLESTGGKILRFNPDGSAPSDNPFPAAPLVWSYGHRNVQGLAFHPYTGQLFETEHGPSGEIGLGAYDEVNLIEPGVNYGWAKAIGAPMLPQYRDPLLTYPGPVSGPVPPSGASFYAGDAIAGWDADLFFASLGAEHLQRVGFDQCGRIVAIERLFNHVYGRLRDVIQGPDGAMYVTTSNKDGRGTPGPFDDRILRISAAQ